MRLTKKQSTIWNGNGFGTSEAVWAVKGFEHIEVRKIVGFWYATDTNTNTKIARGYDKKMLIEVLSEKLA